MASVKKLVATAVLVVFFGMLAVRPLVANPVISEALSDGITDRQVLLVAPLILVALLVVVLRVRSTRTENDWEPPQSDVTSYNSWAERDDEQTEREMTESGTTASKRSRVSILSGQGGARNRDFEIEEQAPEAELSDHLEHLRAQLGDDRTLASDLETLEEVIQDVEGEQRLPARCPHEYCDARWRERGVLGLGTGRYELLDDGETVVCLECENTYTRGSQ